jgi:chemotaxis response regulator CheB
MELGAVDFIAQPKLNVTSGIADYQQEIVEKLDFQQKRNPKNVPFVMPVRKQFPCNTEVQKRF